MAKIITITIDTEGPAFRDGPSAETARVLHRLARCIEDAGTPDESETLHDSAGKPCGIVTVRTKR